MMRFVLPFCLLLMVPCPTVAGAPESRPAPVAAASVVAEGPHTKGEKLALALLGMIGSEKPDRVARGKRLLALQSDSDTLRPLAVALRCKPASLRVFAARALGEMEDERALQPLLHRAVRERTVSVRVAIASALRARSDPNTVAVLAGALRSHDAGRTRNAAEMLGRLRDEEALPHLLARWEARSGAFPRSHFSSVKQVPYLQGFDVEVACTSFIADPHTAVAQPGVVQDVKIVATEQSQTLAIARTIRSALARIVGADHGRTPKAWRAWLARRPAR